MDLIVEALIAILLVVAGVFGLIGSYGLLRLPDTMTRLHAPTKATTLGVGSILIASMIHSWMLEGALSWHELLIALFLFLTAPITATFIAKAHIHRQAPRPDLPLTGTDRNWATLDPTSDPVAPPPGRNPPQG